MPGDAVVGASAVSAAAVLLWWTVFGDRRVGRRVARNLKSGRITPVTDIREQILAAPASERVVMPAARRLALAARRLTPTGVVEKLNNRIQMAGMSSRWPVERTLAAKFILGACGVLLGLSLASTGRALAMAYGLALPLIAFSAPDVVLRLKAKTRQQQIRVSLPDTLDQITVCVEAGLAFESAMARAATTGTGPLADELVRTLQDVQLGVPRREAMRRLSERNEVDELRQFVQAIVQAEEHGVPIARVLRIQAAELREKRRQAAEERAMKVGIKMLFPLVICILPTVFIVILAPAIFGLVDSLGGNRL